MQRQTNVDRQSLPITFSAGDGRAAFSRQGTAALRDGIDRAMEMGFSVAMFTQCPVCKEETLFRTEAVYDGFQKVGEKRICTSCGTEQASAGGKSAPKPDPLAALFGDDARPEKLELFDVEAETGRMCRKCRHYVIHPFTQRCGLHDREVSATDSCPDFEVKRG